MALRNQLPLERIRVFGLAASSLLAHIKSPVIARVNRQPRAINGRSDYAKIEGVPWMLTTTACFAVIVDQTAVRLPELLGNKQVVGTGGSKEFPQTLRQSW